VTKALHFRVIISVVIVWLLGGILRSPVVGQLDATWPAKYPLDLRGKKGCYTISVTSG